MIKLKSFELSIPTRVIVGQGMLNELSNVAGEFGKKALLVEAQGSMRKTWILNKVVSLVNEVLIFLQEYLNLSNNEGNTKKFGGI